MCVVFSSLFILLPAFRMVPQIGVSRAPETASRSAPATNDGLPESGPVCYSTMPLSQPSYFCSSTRFSRR